MSKVGRSGNNIIDLDHEGKRTEWRTLFDVPNGCISIPP